MSALSDEGPIWGYHLDDMNLALGNLVLDVGVRRSGLPLNF